MEIFVFTLCIAVSIGMVVQKMSQASIPSQTRSTTTTTVPPQKSFLEVVSECNAAMEQLRLWVVTSGSTFTEAQWQQAHQSHTQWGTHCTQKAPGWQMPFGMNALRYSIQSQQTAVVPAVQQPAVNPVKQQCDAEAAQYRQGFEVRYPAEFERVLNLPDNRSVFESLFLEHQNFRTQWSEVKKRCTQQVTGWQAPFGRDIEEKARKYDCNRRSGNYRGWFLTLSSMAGQERDAYLVSRGEPPYSGFVQNWKTLKTLCIADVAGWSPTFNETQLIR